MGSDMLRLRPAPCPVVAGGGHEFHVLLRAPRDLYMASQVADDRSIPDEFHALSEPRSTAVPYRTQRSVHAEAAAAKPRHPGSSCHALGHAAAWHSTKSQRPRIPVPTTMHGSATQPEGRGFASGHSEGATTHPANGPCGHTLEPLTSSASQQRGTQAACSPWLHSNC